MPNLRRFLSTTLGGLDLSPNFPASGLPEANMFRQRSFVASVFELRGKMMATATRHPEREAAEL